MQISLKTGLRLDTSIMTHSSCVRWARVVAGCTYIAVIANGIFGQISDDLVLSVTMTVEPRLHVLHHLALNLRLKVMKVRMKATQLINRTKRDTIPKYLQTRQDIFSQMMNIHASVVPGFHNQLYCMCLMRTYEHPQGIKSGF